MDTEIAAEVRRLRRCRDQGVPRSRAEPLSESVDSNDRSDRPEPGNDQKAEPGEGGKSVARERDPLGTVGAVRPPAAGDPHERADALVDPVDESEGQRPQADDDGDVQRKNCRHGLRGDVRQETDHAQPDDRRSHPATACAALRRRMDTALNPRPDVVDGRCRGRAPEADVHGWPTPPAADVPHRRPDRRPDR